MVNTHHIHRYVGEIRVTATTKMEVIEPDEQLYIDHAAGIIQLRHTVRNEMLSGALAALKALKAFIVSISFLL